jgi:hypothetical protein
MSFQKCVTHLSALLVGCALLPVCSFAQVSFQSHQVAQTPSGISVTAHGDFNSDGREDIVSGNQLYLSNGDGTYAAPKTLPAPVGVIGDFNHDGRLDFAAQVSNNIVVYLGNADGTFPNTRTFSASGYLAAADLNHDGKTDLVTVTDTSTGTGYPTTLQIWISNGDGTFSKGQTITTMNPNPANAAVEVNQIIAGDFDGDGKPDIALIYDFIGETTVQVFYGDGAGHLGSPSYITDPNGYIDLPISTADVNNDGRSDLISAANTTGPRYGDLTPLPKLSLFTGNANRTMSYTTIASSQCPASGGIALIPAVADFNGDGVNDLIYAESSCDLSSANTSVVFRPGQGSGSFGEESTISQVLGSTGAPYAVRTTTGTKPDVIFGETTNVHALVLLSNTSTGAFPGCGLSGIAEGVQICTPGSSATSPVKFSIGAAGPTPMRTAAVWVDGKKVAEQLTHAFSNYSFLDASVPLAAGSHAITIYGTGWDNTLQSKSFTLSVGTGGSCPFVGNAVNLCQPLNESTVSSPVTVLASSNVPGTLARMEVWIDSVKKYTETNSATLSYTLSLPPGSHRFAVFAVNTAGGKTETISYATVK